MDLFKNLRAVARSLAESTAAQRVLRAFRTLGCTLSDTINEPISPRPLGLLRIVFSLVLFAEFAHCVHRRDFFFLTHPLQEQLPRSVVVDLWTWGVALVCTMIGFLTPVAAFINYRMTAHYFSFDSLFCYHADMLYLPTTLLLAALPVYRAYSVDNWLMKRVFGIDMSTYPIPRLFNNVIIFWVMGFMYFDSTLYKLESPFWLHGLGFWLPASFPSFTTFSWNAILNREYLVKLAGWITLVFELTFIFLFWIPRLRKYLLVIGVILHLGIAIVFPIPLFGLLMVSLYIAFFPDPQMNRLLDWIGARLQRFKVLEEPTSFVTEWATPKRTTFLLVDRVLAKLVVLVVLVVTAVQSGVTFKLPIFSAKTHEWMRRNFGLTGHHVFGQWQFTAMTQDVALVYYDRAGREYWLPWVKRNGHIGSEAYGRYWSFWWLTSLPTMRDQPYRFGRVIEGWAKRRGVALEEGYVMVKTKPVIARHVWEKDRHAAMEQIPWRDTGKMTWTGGAFRYEVVR